MNDLVLNKMMHRSLGLCTGTFVNGSTMVTQVAIWVGYGMGIPLLSAQSDIVPAVIGGILGKIEALDVVLQSLCTFCSKNTTCANLGKGTEHDCLP